MSRADRLRQEVARAFDRAGDLIVHATLQRRDLAAYGPGVPAEVSFASHDCRILWDDLPLASDARAATGRAPLELRRAFVESPDFEPRQGDRLVTEERTYAVLQARRADAGQGVLHRIAVR